MNTEAQMYQGKPKKPRPNKPEPNRPGPNRPRPKRPATYAYNALSHVDLDDHGFLDDREEGTLQ